MKLAVAMSIPLTSCMPVTGIEKLCIANLSEGLLNPETATFHDFTALSPKQFADLQSRIAFRDPIPGKNPLEQSKIISDHAVYLEKDLQRRTGSLFSMRVRSDTKVGNRVTWTELCRSQKDSCLCIDPLYLREDNFSG